MLDQLKRYVELEGMITEPGFTAKDVRWAIPCDAAGTPTGTMLSLVDDKQPRGRRFFGAPHLTQPEIKRGGAGTRQFLADSLEVVLRLGAPDDPKVEAKHVYFRRLLEQASATMPVLRGIADGLADPATIDRLAESATRLKASPTDVATFVIEDPSGRDRYVLDFEDWKDWWRSFRGSLGARQRRKGPPVARMRCFMTGEAIEPVLTQPKVRGLAGVGGIASGDAFASFKQDAFRSYGLKQGANAALSEEAAVQCAAALSRLVRRGKRFKGVVVAYWYAPSSSLELDPFDIIEGFDDEDEQLAKLEAARGLLDSWQSPGGVGAVALASTPYYCYTLSGASGRVMVRDIVTGPLEDLLESLLRWFGDLEICRRDNANAPARAPKFRAVLGAMVRDFKDLDDLTALESALWRAALRADFPFPRDALARTLARVKIDAIRGDAPRHARIGLLRAVINRSIRTKTTNLTEDHAVDSKLDEAHPSAAYQCGRVMAVLARLQYSALGNVGADLIQRYYASASSSPALALGRLLRNAQFHLDKLDPRLRVWHEKRIASILARIDRQFPSNLDLESQSLFALGYYQQQARDRTRTTPSVQADPTDGVSK